MGPYARQRRAPRKPKAAYPRIRFTPPPGTTSPKTKPPCPRSVDRGVSSRLLLLNPYRVRAPVSGSVTKLPFIQISEGPVAISPAISNASPSQATRELILSRLNAALSN